MKSPLMSRLFSKSRPRGFPELAALLALFFSACPPRSVSAEPEPAPASEQVVPPAPASAQELGLPGPMENDLPDVPIEPYAPLTEAESLPSDRPPMNLPGPAEAPEALPPFSLQTVFLVATGDIAPPRELSIRDVVAMALENNVEIKIQRLQPELGQQQMRFARGAFDPQFSFSTQYSYSETPQNAVEYISTGGLTGGFNDPRTYTAENFFLNWQLGGKTPIGTQYSVGLNQLQSRNDINIQIPPSLFFPEYTSVLGLTLTQPLLKGAGTAVNLAELRVARVQKQIGWYDWQQQLINSLSRTISLYLDLLFASEGSRGGGQDSPPLGGTKYSKGARGKNEALGCLGGTDFSGQQRRCCAEGFKRFLGGSEQFESTDFFCCPSGLWSYRALGAERRSAYSCSPAGSQPISPGGFR